MGFRSGDAAFATPEAGIFFYCQLSAICKVHGKINDLAGRLVALVNWTDDVCLKPEMEGHLPLVQACKREPRSRRSTRVCFAGELARLEGDASTSAPPHGPPNLALWQKGKSQSSRAHLETRIAAALVLESPAEYRRWLLTYARHLAGRGGGSFETIFQGRGQSVFHRKQLA